MKQKAKERLNFIWKLCYIILCLFLLVKTNIVVTGTFVVLSLIFIWLFNQYHLPKSYTMLFTGQPGSGKDVTGVPCAISIYLHNLSKVRRHNRWHKKDQLPMPLLFSNIGIQISKGVWSTKLQADHLLLRRAVPRYSVIYVSELTKFVSQYDWGNPNVVNNLEEFFTMARNYNDIVFVGNTQAFGKAPKQLRQILGSFFHCRNFKHFGRFWEVSIRNVSSLDDAVTTITGNMEESYTKLRGIFPRKKNRQFDSNCYRHLYYSVPFCEEEEWTDFRAQSYLQLPADWTPAMTGLKSRFDLLQLIRTEIDDKKVYLFLSSQGFITDGQLNGKLEKLDLFVLNNLYKKMLDFKAK